MTGATTHDQANPQEIIGRFLTAVVDGDQRTVSELSALPSEEIDSLRVRHSTHGRAEKLEPEFTIVDGDRVTVAVWLPCPTPDGTLDIYSFDTFDVDGSRVIWHMTNAVPGLSYEHTRTEVVPRRPRPDLGARDSHALTPAEITSAFNRAVFDERNPSAVKQFVAEDYVQHAEWRGQSGRDSLEQLVSQIISSPPPPNARPPRPLFETQQGNLVVIAAEIGEIFAFDAYLVRGDLLAEHWSGVDPRRRP